MFDMVKQAMKLLEQAVGELEPERLGREESVQLFQCFVKIERLGAAGKALCARQVADTDAWYQIGGRSPAHCIASVTGTTVGQACTVLQTAELLPKLPATEAAYRAGKLSEPQVEQIVATAAVDRAAEWGSSPPPRLRSWRSSAATAPGCGQPPARSLSATATFTGGGSCATGSTTRAPSAWPGGSPRSRGR